MTTRKQPIEQVYNGSLKRKKESKETKIFIMDLTIKTHVHHGSKRLKIVMMITDKQF